MKSRFLYEGKFSSGETIFLSREESHHLNKVLRLEEGEVAEIITGCGELGQALVIKSDPKKSELEVKEVKKIARRWNVHLAFAIPKSQALDFIIHRSTELGVASLQPLITQHSIHPKDWNQDRWQRVVQEVAKQCQEVWFPKILNPIKLEPWLQNREKEKNLIYCYEESREKNKIELKYSHTDLVIGSEGGFSEEEILMIKARGGISLGLGQNRLRTETASLVALTLVKSFQGEI